MGVMFAERVFVYSLSPTLGPPPRAGEGSVWNRAAREAVVLMASMPGALGWE